MNEYFIPSNFEDSGKLMFGVKGEFSELVKSRGNIFFDTTATALLDSSFCEIVKRNVPAEITDGETTVMPAAFGELSEGILNVSKVKTGALTMCRLVYTNGKYYMHMVTGEGIAPRKWEECGWTQPAPQLPGLEIILPDTERFCDNVMCQHYIISYGDNTQIIRDLCDILGIEVM